MKINILKFENYSLDKRKNIRDIYESLSRLDSSLWSIKILGYQKASFGKDKNKKIPILAFKTKKIGKAVWLIAGVHGEEPAGPNAISENILFLNNLAKKISIVLLPLCNPKGYIKNWRYPSRKDYTTKEKVRSVGDSEHLLLDQEGEKARRKNPACKEAKWITSFLIENYKKYPPTLSIDLHEDLSSKKLYIYSHGKMGVYDPIAIKIIDILEKSGFNVHKRDKTSFEEKIEGGIVSNVKDGSIDEFISSKYIFLNRKVREGPNAKSAIVLETTIKGVSLKKRVNLHSYVIRNLYKYFKIAKEIKNESQHFKDKER